VRATGGASISTTFSSSNSNSVTKMVQVYAGAGTVLWRDVSATSGTVIIDNGGNAISSTSSSSSSSSTTCLQSAGSTAPLLQLDVLEVRGGACLLLTVASPLVTVAAITGDGSGSIEVSSSAVLSVHAVFTYTGVNLMLSSSGSLQGGTTSVTIGNAAALTLSDTAHSNGPATGVHSFGTVIAASNGTLQFSSGNASAATASVTLITPALALNSGSVLQIGSSSSSTSSSSGNATAVTEVIIAAAALTVSGAALRGSSSSASTVKFAMASTAPAVLSGVITLQYITVVCDGVGATWSGGSLAFTDSIVSVAAGALLTVGTSPATATTANTSSSAIVLQPSATLQHSGSSTAVTLGVPLLLQANAALLLSSSTAALSIAAGGSAAAGAAVTVAGTLSFATSGTFTFDPAATLTGNGSVVFATGSTANVPAAVASAALTLQVTGGVLALLSSSTTTLTAPLVLTAGNVTVAQGAALTAATLTVTGGALILSAASSSATATGSFNWSGGYISGPGALSLLSGASLVMSSSSAVPLLLADRLQLSSAGSALWSAGSVSSTQGAVFRNAVGGVLTVATSATVGATWSPGASLTAFRPTAGAVLSGSGAAALPLQSLASTTLAGCAAACVAAIAVPVRVAAVNPAAVATALVACASFAYDALRNVCVLQAASTATPYTALRASALFDYYELVPAWLPAQSSLVNSGTLQVAAPASGAATAATLSVPLVNSGTVSIAAGQALTLAAGGSATDASLLNIAAGATATISAAAATVPGFTFASGAGISGNGMLLFTGASLSAHTLPRQISAPALSLSVHAGASAVTPSAAAGNTSYALQALLVDSGASLQLPAPTALAATTVTLATAGQLTASSTLDVTSTALTVSGAALLTVTGTGSTVTAASVTVTGAGSKVAVASAAVVASTVTVAAGATVSCSGGGARLSTAPSSGQGVYSSVSTGAASGGG
jgi:hypothetical protein